MLTDLVVSCRMRASVILAILAATVSISATPIISWDQFVDDIKNSGIEDEIVAGVDGAIEVVGDVILAAASR